MTDTTQSFILNNSLAAISATICDGKILATDGINRMIHSVYSDRCCSCDCTATARPYLRLRRNACGNGYTALSDCNSRRLYFLDSCFNEQGYINLCPSACPCPCSCNSGAGALTDAMTVLIGGSCYIAASFNDKAFLFDSSGACISLLCEAHRNEYLTDFIIFGSDRYAMGSACDGRQTVTIYDNGNIQSACVDRAFSLRMLLCVNNEIFGLFGQSYIYNKIIPIYSSGILTLPQRAIENSCFTC